MNITIIDDEKILSEKIAKKLKNHWFTVNIFNDVENFDKFHMLYKTDLYIIDLIIWKDSWFKIVEKLRNSSSENKSPIIMISWLDSSENRVYWLNIWADDFLIKPFTPDELIARINAISRRFKNENKIISNLNYKNINYSYKENKIKKAWIEIDLQPKEKLVVELFMKNIWKLVKKSDLIYEIWWEYNDNFISYNNINVMLHKIRTKLWNEFNLETIHSEWYILKE